MMYRSEDPRSRPIAQDAPTGAVTQALKRLTSIVEEAKALNAQLQRTFGSLIVPRAEKPQDPTEQHVDAIVKRHLGQGQDKYYL